MKRIPQFLALVAFISAAAPSLSHEFWIEPVRYQVDAGKTIKARFHNGERFKGNELAFFDRRSAGLQIGFGRQQLELTPRNGDRPAVDTAPLGDGLHIISHETAPSSLTYKTWAKFTKFTTHKDFGDVGARHDARGLPREDFKESYTRHVKALVGVGSGTGADRKLGLETEFVALTNPYTPDFTQNMQVALYYNGATRGDAQVEIFEKSPDGTVKISLTRTNSRGVASFRTKPGHRYLVDAVVLREPTRATKDIAWESLWAGLTFAAPSR